MASMVDLQQLSLRESEQTEWKENVADVDDVVAALCAFANDLANLGGGYVVCGATEGKDEHGFQRLVRSGLTSARLKEIEGKVLTKCRERVSPAITPQVQELASEVEERRILVFIQPATNQAHSFRRNDDGSKHYVRVGRETREARNGLLRDLLVRKRTIEPWDRRSCGLATVSDLDLLALRDTLQRIGMFSDDRGVEYYLSDTNQLSAFVPPLCAKDPLNGILRPRNFAMLLFGRQTQRFVPGAICLFSIYPGKDRSDPHAERHEIAGSLVDQARRLAELLDVQSYTAFDKSDPTSPNAVKYPKRALYEALGNALAHRDYETDDPARITVFSNRIEIDSPGSLPLGVDPVDFREGKAGAKWRNQSLAWFFSRLQIAQAEGQGIPTILRVMREEGCPPPTLEADAIRVRCVLPAHPRHAVLQELRLVEQAIALNELTKAQDLVRSILIRDPLNFRALQLFAEIHQALGQPEPVKDVVAKHLSQLESLPPAVLVQLSEALLSSKEQPDEMVRLSQRLLTFASRGRLEESEITRIYLALRKAHAHQDALALIDHQLREHPEWQRHALLLQLRGDALLGLAKICRTNGHSRKLTWPVRQRAWRECDNYLDQADHALRDALASSVDQALIERIRQNLDYLEKMRRNRRPRTKK